MVTQEKCAIATKIIEIANAGGEPNELQKYLLAKPVLCSLDECRVVATVEYVGYGNFEIITSTENELMSCLKQFSDQSIQINSPVVATK